MLDSLVRVSRRVLKVPKSIASQISVSIEVCPRDPHGQQSSGNGIGTRSDRRLSIERACRGSDANLCSGLALSVYRRASRPEHRGFEHESPKRSHTDSSTSRRPTPNGSRRPTRGKVHAFVTGSTNRRRGQRERHPSHDRSSPIYETRMNFPFRPFGFLRFTPERFHVLLNSLFKVLFIFPSRYLFAIGLVVIFSLRWSLPPT